VLVELAFAMPVLALIFLSVIDVGLVVREHQVLQNAAREGARYSALPQNQISPLNPGASLTDIKNFIIQYAAQEKITVAAGDITVDQGYLIPIGGGFNIDGSEVTITYSRSFLTIARPFFPVGALTLTGRSVFRNLYP
jgi:hypothetical protein